MAMTGIAAGFLLLGNGQPTGPLSGAIGLIDTTLTLNASTCSVPDGSGNVSFTLSGKLRDAGGIPLAARTVALRTARCDDGASATGPEMPYATGQDGGFGFATNEPPTPNYDPDTYVSYGAAFPGDAQYAGCSPATVRKLC